MVGGTMFHRRVIQREISRVLVLNLSGKTSGAKNTDRIFLSLTPPSLLSRGTLRGGRAMQRWAARPTNLSFLVMLPAASARLGERKSVAQTPVVPSFPTEGKLGQPQLVW